MYSIFQFVQFYAHVLENIAIFSDERKMIEKKVKKLTKVA